MLSLTEFSAKIHVLLLLLVFWRDYWEICWNIWHFVICEFSNVKWKITQICFTFVVHEHDIMGPRWDRRTDRRTDTVPFHRPCMLHILHLCGQCQWSDCDNWQDKQAATTGPTAPFSLCLVDFIVSVTPLSWDCSLKEHFWGGFL